MRRQSSEPVDNTPVGHHSDERQKALVLVYNMTHTKQTDVDNGITVLDSQTKLL